MVLAKVFIALGVAAITGTGIFVSRPLWDKKTSESTKPSGSKSPETNQRQGSETGSTGKGRNSGQQGPSAAPAVTKP